MNKWRINRKMLMTDEEAERTSSRFIAHIYRPIFEDILFKNNIIDNSMKTSLRNRRIFDSIQEISKIVKRMIDNGILKEEHENDPIEFVISKMDIPSISIYLKNMFTNK